MLARVTAAKGSFFVLNRPLLGPDPCVGRTFPRFEPRERDLPDPAGSGAMQLERVIGNTVKTPGALAVSPATGDIAYPAG